MEQYVANEKEMSKRRKETLDAIEEVDAGDTIEGDRVMAWLSGWGTKDEIPSPL
jgi:predicted transcriptional regulator